MQNEIGDLNAKYINIIQNNSLFAEYNLSNAAHVNLTNDLDVSSPPLPSKLTKRVNLVNDLNKILKNVVFLHIKGEMGTGKTQVCNLVSISLNKNVFWFRIREYKHQLKSLLSELNITINKSQKLNPFKFFTNKINIDKNSIVVLDDLPNLNNLNCIKEFITLYEICNKYNILLLSSSNYNLPKNIIENLDKFETYNISNFSEDDTKELLDSYNAPKQIFKFIPLINSFSDNYPCLIIATINYLESKNWELKSENLLQNKFIENEVDNFQIIFEQTIEDNEIKELVYRLNNIGRVVTKDEIRLVSSVEPIIEHPFEKILKLIDIWIYKESENQYLLSPILFKLGSKNLNIKVEENINNILATEIIKQELVTPYEIVRGISYFIKAKEYNKAGWFLYQALYSLIQTKNVSEDDVYFIHKFWSDTPFPKEMDIVTKVLIKSSQIILHKKFKKDTSLLFKDFSELLESFPKEKEYLLLMPYMLFITNDFDRENSSTNILKIVKKLPEKIKKDLILDNETGISIESMIFFNIEGIISYESLENWIDYLCSIEIKKLNFFLNTNIENIEFLALLKYRILTKIIKNENDDIVEKIFKLVSTKIDYFYTHNIEKLWVYLVAILIDCLIELNRFEKAKEFRNIYIELTDNYSFKLLINHELALKFVDDERYEESIILYENVIEFNDEKNLIFIDACIYSALAYSKLNKKEQSKQYFMKGIDLYKKIKDFNELYLAKILGEYSILLFDEMYYKESIDTFKEILLLLEKQEKLSDDWKTIELIVGNHLSYINQIILCKNISNDSLSTPFIRSFLYTSSNEELLSLYNIEKTFIIYFNMYELYFFFNDIENGTLFLSKSYELSKKSNLNDFKIFLLIDYYLEMNDYKSYLEYIAFLIQKHKSDLIILYLLSYVLKLNIELNLGINNINEFKTNFIKYFPKDIIDKKYYDIVIFILDNLEKQNYKEEISIENEPFTHRFYLIYECNFCSLKRSIEIHDFFYQEYFINENKNIFSILHKRQFWEKYFFSYWIKTINENKDSFQYSSLVLKELNNAKNEKLDSKECIKKIINLIKNYVKL